MKNELSPAMKAYLQMKEKYKDCILMISFLIEVFKDFFFFVFFFALEDNDDSNPGTLSNPKLKSCQTKTSLT